MVHYYVSMFVNIIVVLSKYLDFLVGTRSKLLRQFSNILNRNEVEPHMQYKIYNIAMYELTKLIKINLNSIKLIWF